jgi:prolactin regulatory element-binding protein
MPIHTENIIYDLSMSNNSVGLFFYLRMHFEHVPQLVVTTTHNLLVYALPTAPLSTTATGSPKKKRKKRSKASNDGLDEKVSSLSLQKTVPLPSSTGEGSTFRAAKYVLLLFQLRVSYFGLLDTIHRISRYYSAL